MSKKSNFNKKIKKINKVLEQNESNSLNNLTLSIDKISKEIDKSNIKTKWDKSLKFIPILTLISTIIIAFFTIKISNGNFEMVKNNQKLTYETKVSGVKGMATKYYEDTTGNQKIIIPMKIENTINSGKIKVVYVVTEDSTEDTGLRFIKLNSDAENGFDYIMNGLIDDLQEQSLNFFVYYIDMDDNIYYDYVVVFSEYDRVVNHIEIRDYEDKVIKKEERKKIIGKESSMEIFNQYDFVTATIYNERVEELNKDLSLQVNSYSKVKQMSKKINSLLKSSILMQE
ncbi:hypothetical protein AB6884_06385 [Carnobacterium maltaromaticum]|uniref:hypothetical protein n=1 Tax=Carnobacterium maltaromaticum TaxID=2751 RepID=UPI0039BDC1C8